MDDCPQCPDLSEKWAKAMVKEQEKRDELRPVEDEMLRSIEPGRKPFPYSDEGASSFSLEGVARLQAELEELERLSRNAFHDYSQHRRLHHA